MGVVQPGVPPSTVNCADKRIIMTLTLRPCARNINRAQLFSQNRTTRTSKHLRQTTPVVGVLRATH